MVPRQSSGFCSTGGSQSTTQYQSQCGHCEMSTPVQLPKSSPFKIVNFGTNVSSFEFPNPGVYVLACRNCSGAGNLIHSSEYNVSQSQRHTESQQADVSPVFTPTVTSNSQKRKDQREIQNQISDPINDSQGSQRGCQIV